MSARRGPALFIAMRLFVVTLCMLLVASLLAWTVEQGLLYIFGRLGVTH
jgi:hypothetical protein